MLFLRNIPSFLLLILPSCYAICHTEPGNPKVCRCHVKSTEYLANSLKAVKPETERLMISGVVPEIKADDFRHDNLLNVTFLSLKNVTLQRIAVAGFEGLENLSSLILEDNLLSTLPDGVFNYTNKLKVLNLNRNKLTELPIISPIHACLQQLFLNENFLLEITQNWMSTEGCIQNLSVKKNNLKRIIGQFSNTLQQFDLSNNDISWKDCQFTAPGLDSLTIVNVGFPVELTKLLPDMPNLNYLDLSDNNLNKVPRSLDAVSPKLQTLILANNDFPRIGADYFTNFTQLKTLSLRNCNIENLVSPFENMKNLQNLDMSQNKLEHINAGMFNTTAEYLNLQNSKIRAIDYGSFDNLPQLKYLNLSTNLLNYINPGTFESIKSAEINVDSNPIICDCYIRPIRDWIIVNQVQMNLSCSLPTNLQSRMVASLKDSELDCGPPSFQRCCARIVQAYEHSNVTVQFRTFGKPEPNLTYFVVNGNPLPLNQTSFSKYLRTLIIVNVKKPNAGNFTCTADNGFGKKTVSVSLVIIEGRPMSYKVRLALIIGSVLIAVIVLFSFVWFLVFVCSKNRYFVYQPWIDDDRESSIGSVQIRR